MFSTVKASLSRRTKDLLLFDLKRAKARLKNRHSRLQPASSRLHLGCGERKIPGWLNVDVSNSDYDVDLACGKLPWKDKVFDVVISQHVIEHLEINTELFPLLKEVRRTLKDAGKVYLSCPDMEKVCKAYLEDKGKNFFEDKKKRFGSFDMQDLPVQHVINILFHQNGSHKNLFDFELLRHLLDKAGFKNIQKVEESVLLQAYTDVPKRNDDIHSLYVVCTT